MRLLKKRYNQKSPLRVDRYLADSIKALSRADVQRAIEEGALKINSQRVKDQSYRLQPDDRIEFTYSEEKVEAVPGKLVVRYADENLLAADKPAGVVVFPTRKQGQISLAGMVKAAYPECEQVGPSGRFGIVHRLDKDTSGLVLTARNNQTYDYLKQLFAKRKIDKEYLALVFGRPKQHGIIKKPLTKIGQRGSSRVRVDEAGKEAVTEYWLEQVYQDQQGEGGVDEYSLVRVGLHTGRTHQIRVHLADFGHPVMGDKLYGKPESLRLQNILPRQFLHASRLEFKSVDGTWIDVRAKLPKDLWDTLKRLKKKT